MARGRASMMFKRLSHITVVVRDKSKEETLKTTTEPVESQQIQPSNESEVQ
jgi:hypothetical protein